MNSTLSLLLLQDTCFSITLVLALMLMMSRWHMRSTSKSYDMSRWLLIAALSLYVIHYLLQMIFGFRASGEDVGALINIVFYLPVAFLMTCATLRISAGQRYLRRFVKVGVAGIAVTLILFVTGLCVYGSLHMLWIFRAIEVIYVAMIAFFIFNPGGELRRMNRRIEEETADDNTMYHIYMHSSTVLLYAMGLIGALSVFSTIAVASVAIFFLLSLIFYVVSFMSLGFGIQSLSDVLDDENSNTAGPDTAEDAATDSSAPEQAAPRLSETISTQISQAIEQWRREQGYGSQNLTLVTMADRLGVTKRQLSQYLTENEGSTFRVWLSNIRIEEAKRMLAETNYSIEAIGETCGFSSRSWMTEKFKASTGMSPKDWRDAKKKG